MITKETQEKINAAYGPMLEALEAITSNVHIDLGDLVYNVRDLEGMGWEGPSVKQWSDAVEKVKKALSMARGIRK